MIKRTAVVLAVLGLSLAAASPAYAAFGIEPGTARTAYEVSEGVPGVPGASSHPYSLTVGFKLNTDSEGRSVGGEMRDLLAYLPPGFAGYPFAVQRCSRQEFEGLQPECAPNTQVGVVHATIPGFGNATGPMFNLVPPPGVAAEIGFSVAGLNGIQDFTLIAEGGEDEGRGRRYGLRDQVRFPLEVTGLESIFWGTPSDPGHDDQRGVEAAEGKGGGISYVGPHEAFLTLPAECSEPLKVTLAVASKLAPGAYLSQSAQSLDGGGNPAAPLGCGSVPFAPQVAAATTSRAAASSTGLDFELKLPNEGLTNPGGIAETEPQKIEVTLPEGVTANPSAAEGLATCSEAQYESEQLDTAPGAGCPEASKLGSIVAHSPLIDEPIVGSLYLATPYENPEGTLLAIYVVFRATERGVLLKQSGKIVPDPQTGQLVTTLEGLPPLPYSDATLHFKEGARGVLVTPDKCGQYATTTKLYPFSEPNNPVVKTSYFQIERGVNGGACPTGREPFEAGFEAGAINNQAGAYSPFYMRLTRNDGDQDLTKFSAVLPPGVTGKIAGLTQCPQANVEAAKAKSAGQELVAPSCPASSLMGRTQVGAGVGSVLTWVPGSLYLGGPYHGDPLSIVSITPAKAGPFDVGTVVVQEALTINPLTAEVEVDGSASDPIPHILKGIPLKVRDIRVHVDQPEVTLNATSCEPEQAQATIWSGGANVFSAADDTPHALGARYQAASCASLGFKPKLGLKLNGSRKNMRRSGHPQLTAVLTPKPGDANLAQTTILFPHSMFIDQFHVGHPCTRVKYFEGAGQGANCPKASILGTVKAWTPLLDEPLEGKVYFRTNGGERELPDTVLNLNGQFHIEQVGFVDSKHERLRTRFASVPDAPISRVVIKLFGGKRGVLENSANLCASKQKARLTLAGQNGRSEAGDAVMQTPACKTKKAKRHARHGRRR